MPLRLVRTRGDEGRWSDGAGREAGDVAGAAGSADERAVGGDVEAFAEIVDGTGRDVRGAGEEEEAIRAGREHGGRGVAHGPDPGANLEGGRGLAGGEIDLAGPEGRDVREEAL